MADKSKSPRGFYAMKQQGREDEVREIARKGGSAYHKKRGNHGSDNTA